LRHRHDVADVLADHRLASRQSQALHAEMGEAVEEHLHLGQGEVGRVEEGSVAIAAPEVAAIGYGEGRGERPRRAVHVPREQAAAERDRHVEPRVKSHGPPRERTARSARNRPWTSSRRPGWIAASGAAGWGPPRTG